MLLENELASFESLYHAGRANAAPPALSSLNCMYVKSQAFGEIIWENNLHVLGRRVWPEFGLFIFELMSWPVLGKARTATSISLFSKFVWHHIFH